MVIWLYLRLREEQLGEDDGCTDAVLDAADEELRPEANPAQADLAVVLGDSVDGCKAIEDMLVFFYIQICLYESFLFNL